MFTVHATANLRQRVKAPLVDSPSAATTALGDWYATAMFWRPQVVLLVNQTTLLPVLMPLAPAATLLDRFPTQLGDVLDALEVDPRFVADEVATTIDGHWAKTNNRSVTGTMNEFAFLAGVDHDQHRSPDLTAMAVRLAGTPCGALRHRHHFPDHELHALVADALPD